jgi:4-amino-4-deoxy-L-arabinose transferase-like glycosyltransferase
LNPINTSDRRLILWFASAAAIIFCLFGNLGAIGLVGPDEPRYAWIARAMAETGDWVTPRLYGQPWFEKPILYYWAAAVGFRLHLPAEWAARLPSSFAALAAALAIGWLGWRYYAHDLNSVSAAALIAPLLFATTVAAIGFSRSASPDMLFSASIALATASAASVLGRAGALRSIIPASAVNRPDAVPLALFGFFLALGTLAKGPAAVALAGGAVGLWALFTRKWRSAFRLAHPIAITVFCVVALPWYVVCAVRNPDFLRVFIFRHNFERYLTPMFQHRQPLWFFGPIVLIALVPWTVLLWPVAQDGIRLWRQKSWRDSPGFFIACWAVFPIVFFSFSQSKLPGYVLPAIPPLALLCAVAGIRAIEGSGSETRAVFAGTGITWLLLAIAAWRALPHIFTSTSEDLRALATTWMVAAFLVGSLLVLCSVWRPQVVIAVCVLSVAVLVEIASLTVLPKLDPFLSARSHAQFMRNDQHPDRIFTYQLRRGWNYGLSFYFHREIPEWSPADREAALVLTTPEGFAEIQKLGRFRGELDEPYVGILYVPVQREPR